MARKSMNILDLVAWLRLWRDKLEGARIDNVYNLRGSEGIVLKLKGGQAQGDLVIEAGRRVHFTRRDLKEREVVPTGLAALMRKHVRGARIEGVSLMEFDRVAVLSVQGGYRIVAELVPRGVIALLSPDGVILGSSRYEEFRDRVVRPKRPYQPPPLSDFNPFTLTGEDLARLAFKGRDLVRGLVRGAKIPGEVAEEAIFRCGGDPGLKPDEVPGSVYACIAEKLRELYEEAMMGRGYLALSEPPEADPFRPTRFERVRGYPGFDDALDDLFASGLAGGESGDEDPELARLRASLEEARRRAAEYRVRAAGLRRAAEVLASRYHEAEEALRRAAAGVAVSWPVAEVRDREAILDVEGVRFSVKLGEGLDRVIVDLYRRAGELEAKAERAERAAVEAMSRIEELRLRGLARRYQALARLRRRYWFERYHWTVTRSGFLVVGGRDASQNESVVRKYLGARDIFMHADIHGAPAVVIKTGGAEPGEGDLLDAAVVAAVYSKAWRAGLGSVQVYWVWGEQVSKSPPAGEYLAKGGFMVYGRKNYVGPVKLELAIGVALDREGAPLVVAGSVGIVERYSIAYTVLVPGDFTVQEVAGLVKKALASRLQGLEEKAAVLGVPEEEVAQRIPGRARLLRAERGRGEVFEPPSATGEA